MSPYNVQDAELIKVKALPAAGAANYTDAIDLGAQSGKQDELVPNEFEVSLPATVTLVNTKAITFALQTDNDPAFGSPTTLNAALLVVTGTGGNVSAAASARFRLPTNRERYIRVGATVPADAGTSTAYNYTLKALF